jgi:hypothetical protein
MATYKQEASGVQTLISTDLNNLANAAAALGPEFDNAAGLWIDATFQLEATFGSAPTANSTIDLYIIPSYDGTNFTNAVTGVAGSAPVSSYVGGFPLSAVTTIQRIPLAVGLMGPIRLPPLKFKGFVVNKSGVGFPASGSTVKMILSRYQSV